jgi:hypothetical protein
MILLFLRKVRFFVGELFRILVETLRKSGACGLKKHAREKKHLGFSRLRAEKPVLEKHLKSDQPGKVRLVTFMHGAGHIDFRTPKTRFLGIQKKGVFLGRFYFFFDFFFLDFEWVKT